LRELFHFSYWFVRTYAKGTKPNAGIQFSVEALPRTAHVEATTLARLQEIAKRFADQAKPHEAAEAARAQTEAQRVEIEAENARLRAEIAAIKQANAATADTHDYNEAQTRDAFIDLLLHEAGWPLDQARDREFPVTGMPNAAGEGFVDYVLWGDDGKPLALVEAKRTKNGYEHWLWDDASYPPRSVQGFLKKDELLLMHQRRATRRSLASIEIDSGIAGRFYQARAIRRIDDAFEKDHQRKALLVMATG
jgi:type I restriction enzyme R subunit